jgi:hypothetical protein
MRQICGQNSFEFFGVRPGQSLFAFEEYGLTEDGNSVVLEFPIFDTSRVVPSDRLTMDTCLS